MEVGNIASPEILNEGFIIADTKPCNIRIGFDYQVIEDLGFTFKKDFKNAGYNSLKIGGRAYFSEIGINIKERLDIYSKIGTLLIEPRFIFNSQNYSASSNDGLLLKGGFKLTLISIKDFVFGGDIKYEAAFINNNYLCRDDTPISSENMKYTLHGWQVAVGGAYQLPFFIPYLGLSYHEKSLTFRKTSFLSKDPIYLDNRKKLGLFIGTSITTGSYFLLNIEAKLINEQLATISGVFRF